MGTTKKANCYARGGKVNRAKATTIKAGVTKNRNRKYGCGGKLKSK